MPRKPSSFDGESYKGYKVSLRLLWENLEEYEPLNLSNPGDEKLGTPFTFAVLAFIELITLILDHFFATPYRLTYPG